MVVMLWLSRIVGWLVILSGMVSGLFALLAPAIVETTPEIVFTHPWLVEVAEQGLFERVWFPLLIIFIGGMVAGLAKDSLKKFRTLPAMLSLTGAVSCMAIFGLAVVGDPSSAGRKSLESAAPLNATPEPAKREGLRTRPDEILEVTLARSEALGDEIEARLDEMEATGRRSAEPVPGSEPTATSLEQLSEVAASRNGFTSEKTIFHVTSSSISRLQPPVRHRALGMVIPSRVVIAESERGQHVQPGDQEGFYSSINQTPHDSYGFMKGGTGICNGTPIFNGEFELVRTEIRDIRAYRMEWTNDQFCAKFRFNPQTCEILFCTQREYRSAYRDSHGYFVIGRRDAERLNEILKFSEG